MSIIKFIIILLVGGFAAWLIETFVPLSPPFRVVFRAVCVLILILLIIQVITGLVPLSILH